jgi:hypothetical protein
VRRVPDPALQVSQHPLTCTCAPSRAHGARVGGVGGGGGGRHRVGAAGTDMSWTALALPDLQTAPCSSLSSCLTWVHMQGAIARHRMVHCAWQHVTARLFARHSGSCGAPMLLLSVCSSCSPSVTPCFLCERRRSDAKFNSGCGWVRTCAHGHAGIPTAACTLLTHLACSMRSMHGPAALKRVQHLSQPVLCAGQAC